MSKSRWFPIVVLLIGVGGLMLTAPILQEQKGIVTTILAGCFVIIFGFCVIDGLAMILLPDYDVGATMRIEEKWLSKPNAVTKYRLWIQLRDAVNNRNRFVEYNSRNFGMDEQQFIQELATFDTDIRKIKANMRECYSFNPIIRYLQRLYDSFWFRYD